MRIRTSCYKLETKSMNREPKCHFSQHHSHENHDPGTRRERACYFRPFVKTVEENRKTRNASLSSPTQPLSKAVAVVRALQIVKGADSSKGAYTCEQVRSLNERLSLMIQAPILCVWHSSFNSPTPSEHKRVVCHRTPSWLCRNLRMDAKA